MKIYQHLYFKDKNFGSITYLISGKEVLTVDIVAEQDIKKLSTQTTISIVFSRWFSLLRA